MTPPLNGKVALVAGATRGAGRGIAIEQVDQDLAAGIEDLRQGRVVSAEESMLRARAIIDRVASD